MGTWVSRGPAGEGAAFELDTGCGVLVAALPGIRHEETATAMTMKKSAAAERSPNLTSDEVSGVAIS
jgi:hypothetical protein